ncbi:MAG: DUF3995 domain-containing protein [Holophagaceae bacterium]|nr:DUF3995 domain-containing protein [Holophagaceae bacterium]
MLPILLVATLLLLALLHLYWLGGGRAGLAAAVPEREGRPRFTPSAQATALVAAALTGAAVLVADLAGWLALPLPRSLRVVLGGSLALAFLARAIGDFRWVGFFKRERGTRFSTWDSRLYAPLCLGLAVGVFLVLRASR